MLVRILVAVALLVTGGLVGQPLVGPAVAAPAIDTGEEHASRSGGTVQHWPAGPDATSAPHPRIVAVYPNPVFHEDEGEFVVIDVPAGHNLSTYVLSDGESRVRLPSVAVSGTIAVAENGSAARMAGYRVVELDRFPALSNAGDHVELRRVENGGESRTLVDSLSYSSATEATLQTPRGPVPIGATAHSPTTVESVNVTTFVLPDDSRPVEAVIRSAESRLYLAGYTLTSQSVRDALLDAASRGVSVRVLLDGAPVGGDAPRQVRILDTFSSAGVDVRMVGGPRARYAFHHAKYAVADDTAIVLTENWKASGTGGHGNRGWGIVVRNESFASALATVFESDADWRGVERWERVREPASAAARPPANDSYATRFPARNASAETVTLAVTPDNAESVVTAFVTNASTSLRVQQVTLGEGRLRWALLDSARRGVDVDILLSGQWYVRSENRIIARCLNGYAERTGIPLEVRLVEPRSRFGKVHAKVAVADGEHVLLGSLNWNEHALERNREVIVVARGDDIGRYYGRVFRADWRGGAWRVPWTVVGAAALSVVLLVAFLRRVLEFDADAVEPSRGTTTGQTVWVDEYHDATEARRSGEAGGRSKPPTERRRKRTRSGVVGGGRE